MHYFIQIKDHINKSTRVINKITDLDTYNSDFNTVIGYLNKDDLFSVIISDGEARLSKAEATIIPGYIYNSSKIVNTLAYTLSLIKIDNQLSNVFQSNCTDRETQTNEQLDTKYVQTQEGGEKETKSSQTTEENNSESIEECNGEFGEFQGYTQEFTNINLNEPGYSYCNYYNSYNSYSEASCNPYNDTYSYSYNPFTTVMNLRENEDVNFSFGSQVPRNPTQINPIQVPELITELKFRLAQPNSGLSSKGYNLS
jgi:hypothetical protein